MSEKQNKKDKKFEKLEKRIAFLEASLLEVVSSTKNLIKRMEAWCVDSNNQLKDHFENLEKERIGALEFQRQHANQVEQYLAGFNKILEKKL